MHKETVDQKEVKKRTEGLWVLVEGQNCTLRGEALTRGDQLLPSLEMQTLVIFKKVSLGFRMKEEEEEEGRE